MVIVETSPVTIETIIKSLEHSLNKSVDDYLVSVQAKARDMIARGIDPDTVRAMLLSDIQNNTGDFKQLTGNLGWQIDKALGQTASDMSNQVVKGLSNQFEWVWEPNAEHCETCDVRNGQIKSYDDWEQLGLPGAGTTKCTIYCQCTLIPV